MNNARRKCLAVATKKIEDAKYDIECIRDDEQEYFDNMPESIQGGEKGDKATEIIDILDEMIGDLEQCLNAWPW